jgi:hypothetical protein
MDAPEVDPRVILRAPDARVGERQRAKVTAVTEEYDLLAERT